MSSYEEWTNEHIKMSRLEDYVVTSLTSEPSVEFALADLEQSLQMRNGARLHIAMERHKRLSEQSGDDSKRHYQAHLNKKNNKRKSCTLFVLF